MTDQELMATARYHQGMIDRAEAAIDEALEALQALPGYARGGTGGPDVYAARERLASAERSLVQAVELSAVVVASPKRYTVGPHSRDRMDPRRVPMPVKIPGFVCRPRESVATVC